MMQILPGTDLIALAAVYGLVEVSKFIAQKRNHIVPRMADTLSEIVRGQDRAAIKASEFNKTLAKTLERIERKMEAE